MKHNNNFTQDYNFILAQPPSDETCVLSIWVWKLPPYCGHTTAGYDTPITGTQSPMLPQGELAIPSVPKPLVPVCLLWIGEDVLPVEVGHLQHRFIEGNHLKMLKKTIKRVKNQRHALSSQSIVRL